MSASVMPASAESQKQSSRVASIDIFRGLTILLMIFVNDLGPAAPAWMHHIQPPTADGMTLADIVFPFFLFIAGVSIPLACHASRRREQNNWQIFGHVLVRGIGLLLMGMIEVNRYAETTLGPDLWGLLAFVFIILAWCVVPSPKHDPLSKDELPNKRSVKRNVFLTLKIIGALGLLAMFVIYRREPVSTNVLGMGDVEQWTWLRTEWWGILGLIGWAYLVSATIYLLFGSRREWLMAGIAMLMLLFIGSRSGGFFSQLESKAWLEPLLPIVQGLESGYLFVNRYVDWATQLGSLPAVMMSGCILGTILLPNSEIKEKGERIRWSLMFAGGLFLAGLMTDSFAGINKINATPTYCFWCASLAVLVWVGLFVVLDVLGWTGWSASIRPAGSNPLIAYLLHPILIFILSLTGLGATVRAYSSSESSMITVLGSVVMAIAICALTSLIAKLGLRIRI